jgi:hypothetical protein
LSPFGLALACSPCDAACRCEVRKERRAARATASPKRARLPMGRSADQAGLETDSMPGRCSTKRIDWSAAEEARTESRTSRHPVSCSRQLT